MNPNKNSRSLISKVVILYSLLFLVFLLVLLLVQNQGQTIKITGILLLISLVVTAYFAYDTTQNIRTISHDVDRISKGNFEFHSNDLGSPELDLLSQKIQQLGEAIQTSQDNLESQHNQLNGILGYMTDGVIATDRRGQVILANTAALHFLSTTEDQILSQNIAEALGIDNYFAFRDLLEKTPDIAIDSRNSYGAHVRLRVNFSIFRRESGYISGIVAVLHDVTDDERLERERKLFVSNVSHELRTPLTTVKSYLETLDDGEITNPERAREFIAISLTETDHMIRMISDLLSLSRIDQGRMQLEQEVVNLTAFLTHQVARFDKILSDQKNQQIKIDPLIPLQPVWMEIDPDKMRQILDNLLSNAIKYSPDGGVITLKFEIRGQQAIITVKDQGIGIPPADLPHIFDRFYRVDKARNHDIGGTGLGLSIAYDLVKLHGGQIIARSNEDKGSEFSILLPYEPINFYEEGEWGNDN